MDERQCGRLSKFWIIRQLIYCPGMVGISLWIGRPNRSLALYPFTDMFVFFLPFVYISVFCLADGFDSLLSFGARLLH